MSASGRHARQVRFAPISTRGQARIESARVLLVGCGALGGHLAQSLVRAGIGELRLVDRDTVEETNLPRQVLFTEAQARAAMPKALASVESLAPIGARTLLAPRVAHLDARLLDELGEGVDLVLDGTDNLETRYLLNDWCVARGVPWVYGGVVGASGLVLPVRPGVGACLACAFPAPPPAGTLPTCETAGVIQPAVALVAALQAAAALRLVVDPEGTPSKLVEIDAWNLRVRELHLPRDPGCRACARREFPHLSDAAGPRATRLCGRHTVQVRGGAGRVDLLALAARLGGDARVVAATGSLLRFEIDGLRLTVFADARALVEGTEDEARALAAYDRWIGA
jgi:adenylyltransferase/sulfurtransferase